MDLEVYVFGPPIREQLHAFELSKRGKKYNMVVTSKVDNKYLYEGVIDIAQANKILSTIFYFIEENRIVSLRFDTIRFDRETLVHLGNLIQNSNLQFLRFVSFVNDTDSNIMPFIFQSKIKSIGWYNHIVPIKQKELKYLSANIHNNYYLQNIVIKGYDKSECDEYLVRNQKIAETRFRNTITLLLINRFGTLKFIPVDVFRIIAKKFYFGFIESIKK